MNITCEIEIGVEFGTQKFIGNIFSHEIQSEISRAKLTDQVTIVMDEEYGDIKITKISNVTFTASLILKIIDSMSIWDYISHIEVLVKR